MIVAKIEFVVILKLLFNNPIFLFSVVQSSEKPNINLMWRINQGNPVGYESQLNDKLDVKVHVIENVLAEELWQCLNLLFLQLLKEIQS